MCAWVRCCGGSKKTKPIIISGNQCDYRHDATLISGTDSMYFTSPQTPYIYDVDFTNKNTLTIVAKGGYGGGAWFYVTIGNDTFSFQFGSTLYETITFNVSNITGIQNIKLSYSVNLRCDISSMILN